MARALMTDDGYVCVTRKTGRGVWCGYVAVPPTHPWHGLDYMQIESVKVHGGLTYAEHRPPEDALLELRLASGDLVDTGWWLGFDCGHWGDFIPVLQKDGHVWTEDEVWLEVEKLLTAARHEAAG